MGVDGSSVLVHTFEAGPWGGIVFERGSAGILENVVVHCAAKGISGDQAGVTRRSVTVQGAK